MLSNLFPIQLPIAKSGIFWNGRTDEFNNIGCGLEYSQKYGHTTYADTGVYGYDSMGNPLPHNGHDFAGVRNTPLVAPCDIKVTYTGWDEKGYGNFLFFETEEKEFDGKMVKMQFVLAHCNEIIATVGHYEAGDILAYMGSTGMSTGNHTHFGGRPLINGNEWLYKENRGYIDLTDFFITKPIYNKQDLYNMQLQLISKKGDTDVYAVSPDGKANLIINWSTFQKGLELGMWKEEIDQVDELPEMGKILILINNN